MGSEAWGVKLIFLLWTTRQKHLNLSISGEKHFTVNFQIVDVGSNINIFSKYK
jgi:hypothetical protein